MSDVKRRSYDATRRRESARTNRRAMLEAATVLLEGQGYAATTLTQVAQRSRLSKATVYKAFGNKPAMVKAAFDHAMAGDDDPTPIPRREHAARILAEVDPVRKLELYTEGMLGRAARSTRLQLVVRAAAAVDEDMRTIWDEITTERLRGMGVIAANLAQGGHLRPDVSRNEARDVLWTYCSPELYELLVMNRGWSGARYQRWVCRALVAALLPRGPSGGLTTPDA